MPGTAASLFGAVNASRLTDLRGLRGNRGLQYLILINGRRVNDIDMGAWTSPRFRAFDPAHQSLSNSGAVLYGDNVMGGVINIVTKTGVTGPPLAARIEVGGGSYGQRQVAASALHPDSGPWSTSFYGKQINSDGYRVNNKLAQHDAIGDIRYTTPDLTAYLTLSGDEQALGFPGGRLVDPSTGVNQLVTDRKGAATPFDHAEKQGANATAGFIKSLGYGAELIVDGGVRDKQEASSAACHCRNSISPTSMQIANVVTYTTFASIKNVVFGMPSNILTGIDFYDATFHQNRGPVIGAPPIHMYDLSQQTVAAYWQQSIQHPSDHRLLLHGGRDPAFHPYREETRSTRPRRTISATPRPCRSTTGKTSTRCISAWSIVSTTCSRCSGRPPRIRVPYAKCR